MEDRYPIEVCCPNCKEVVILVECIIPCSEKISNLLKYCDTPMVGSNPIDHCPVCKTRINGEYLGWVRLIMSKIRQHNNGEQSGAFND